MLIVSVWQHYPHSMDLVFKTTSNCYTNDFKCFETYWWSGYLVQFLIMIKKARLYIFRFCCFIPMNNFAIKRKKKHVQYCSGTSPHSPQHMKYYMLEVYWWHWGSLFLAEVFVICFMEHGKCSITCINRNHQNVSLKHFKKNWFPWEQS